MGVMGGNFPNISGVYGSNLQNSQMASNDSASKLAKNQPTTSVERKSNNGSATKKSKLRSQNSPTKSFLIQNQQEEEQQLNYHK